MDLRQRFLHHLAPTTFSPLALEFVRAEGPYLYDSQGKAHMDLISGIGVANLGHSHPEIVAAVQQQAAQHMHLMVYGEYAQVPQVAYAEALLAALPASIDQIYWGNSGAEAVDGALKLAKRATGRTEILSFEGSYHGSTTGPLSAMGNECMKSAYRPLVPGHRIFPYNRPEVFDAIGARTAAVLVELIQAESGYIPADAAWLQALEARCRATGALLIVDEIQTGFGRSGEAFAFSASDIVPDVICLAKALGGGMPLGAFAASRALMATLAENPMLGHLTTFGGHPVSCAAGLAAWNLLQRERFALRAPALEDHFRRGLSQHPAVREIRGRGALLAVVLDSFDQVLRAQQLLIADGYLTDWFLFENCALRLAPPLTLSDEHAQSAVHAIWNALERC
ncbi:MAG: aspartate aminotransferase family protein [Bacteroidetes bacterium]|nr:aspartate aminotransferase family protein [Bacteroidota bacterium]